MTTRIDARQSRQRALLDQLSLNTDVKLDTLLNLINDEIQPPLRLRQANPSSLTLFVDAISVTTQDGSEGHGRTRTIQPFGGLIPSFTNGSIIFPGTSGGSITASGLTLAASYTLTVASGQWIKVMLALNTDGQIVLTFGTTGASESAAGFPDIDTGVLPIGYVSMQNIGGTIQNVTGSRIYQFAGGGSGAGGSGSGTFKNYLSKWFDGEANISGVSNGGVSDTGNRSAADAIWASTNTANITVQRSTGTILRGKYSILVNVITGSATGSTFVESPTFTLDNPEQDPANLALNLYVSFVVSQGVDQIHDVVLVRYDSAGVYQEKVPVYGTFTLSGATPPSQLITTANKRYFGYSARISGSGLSTTDKYALRIRSASASAGGVYIEDLYVGPNSDIGVGPQRFVGVKQYADEVELREGMNVPQTLDFTGTKTVPANETTFVGKLDVASGTTINLSASTSNLVVVGSVTGSGTISGPGVLTSI